MLPKLYELAQSKEMIQTFGGLDCNLHVSDGEFSDMRNMTSSFYPLLSPRGKRGTVKVISSPQGMIAKDALAYVDGTKVVYNDMEIDLNLSTTASDCPKQLVSMGAYLLVFPDRKYLNTQNLSDYGSLDASVTTTSGSTVTFTMCKADGTDYENVIIQSDAPESPSNGQYWIDTSQSNHILKVYSETSNTWVQVPTTYIRISFPGIGQPFKQWDGVTISGCTAVGTTELNNTAVVYAREDNYIVVVGLLDQVETQTTSVTVERKAPVMDFVTESENRIWGCHYGIVNGKCVNEIYACKLGDPFNWNCFMGISTDSYAVSVGSDGIFTGAITHLGHPLFFKEDCIHKIYGNYPSNFQVSTTNCRGVQKGSEKSLVIVNETLYYKSTTDICAYTGSLPDSVSYALGQKSYGSAVSGALGNKLYLSMKDSAGEWNLLVYDTEKSMWHKEDSTHALCFATCDSDLFYIDADSKKLISVGGSKGTTESAVEWMAETGTIGYSYPDNKYISRFQIRMSLVAGSEITVFVQYDSSGEWLNKGTLTGTTVRTFVLPIIPVRCDHMKIKFVGTGECKVYSIAKLLEIGGDT